MGSGRAKRASCKAGSKTSPTAPYFITPCCENDFCNDFSVIIMPTGMILLLCKIKLNSKEELRMCCLEYHAKQELLSETKVVSLFLVTNSTSHLKLAFQQCR